MAAIVSVSRADVQRVKDEMYQPIHYRVEKAMEAVDEAIKEANKWHKSG